MIIRIPDFVFDALLTGKENSFKSSEHYFNGRREVELFSHHVSGGWDGRKMSITLEHKPCLGKMFFYEII